MTLYEIDKAILEAIEQAINFVDEETGEISNVDLSATLEALQTARDEKLENVGLYIKNLAAEADLIKAEEAALRDRRQAKERKAERLKTYLTASLLNSEQSKFETPRLALSFRKSVAVEITNEAALPAAYVKTQTVTTPDKNAIKAAIKSGKKVTGATLTERKALQIK